MAAENHAGAETNDHQRDVVELAGIVRPAVEHDGEGEQRGRGAEGGDRLVQIHSAANSRLIGFRRSVQPFINLCLGLYH